MFSVCHLINAAFHLCRSAVKPFLYRINRSSVLVDTCETYTATHLHKICFAVSSLQRVIIFSTKFLPVHQFLLILVVTSQERARMYADTHSLIGHAFPLYLDVLPCLHFFPALPPVWIFPHCWHVPLQQPPSCSYL